MEKGIQLFMAWASEEDVDSLVRKQVKAVRAKNKSKLQKLESKYSTAKALLKELDANCLQYLDWDHSPENGVEDFVARVKASLKTTLTTPS